MTRSLSTSAIPTTSVAESSSNLGTSAATTSNPSLIGIKSSSRHSTAVGIGIGVGVGLGGALILLAVVALMLRRRLRKNARQGGLPEDLREKKAEEMDTSQGTRELATRPGLYELGQCTEQRPAELEEAK